MGWTRLNSPGRLLALGAAVMTAGLVVSMVLASRSSGTDRGQVAVAPSAPTTAASPLAAPTRNAVARVTAPTSTVRPPAPTPTPTPTPTPAPTPTSEPFTGDAAVQAGIAAVDRLDARLPASVEVGVAVQDRATGKLVVGKYGAQQFYSASVAKLFLITELLHEKEAGEIQLTATDIDLMKRALSASDDAAMDSLWETFDGPQTLSELIESLQLTQTTVPTDTGEWGEMLTTSSDVIAVYDDVLDRLTTADRDFVVGALGAATDSGADGFDQAFGLLAPPRRADVKAKQGWMSYQSKYTLDTTGLLGSDNRYVVALLTTQSAAAGWDSARSVDNEAIAALLGRNG
ncbi:MAG TPA: hypothetical protein VHX59_07840 [Mycobacteriales bacterium]|jgi:hypothetical protein|nr:hypothetical protein [Mycobacteriales bacterium]